MIDTKIDIYKVGDLVYYNPHAMYKPQKKKLIGVVIEVMSPTYKLFKNFSPGQRQIDFEYRVAWFSTGGVSNILGLNLKKIKTTWHIAMICYNNI